MATGLKKPKVMLVQHDRELGALNKLVIAKNCQVRSSHDAQDCVAQLDGWDVDVIVVDLGLPGHSGFEILHELQSYEDWRSIPVIALSNLDAESYGLNDDQWQSYGVRELLYKPATKPRDILDLINKLAVS